MRGYCPKCREYRSDNGMDAWQIVWVNGLPLCRRCGSIVDVWDNPEKQEAKKRRRDKEIQGSKP